MASLFALGGCISNTVEDPETAGELDSGSADSGGDSGEAADEASTSGTPQPDPSTSGTPQPDPSASGPDDGAGTSGGPSGMPGVTHPDCTEPFPDPPPALPSVNVGPDGTPRFALWQDLSCDDPSVQAEQGCMGEAECGQGICTTLGGTSGVCTSFDIDIWCDGEGEVTGTSDGSCWICMFPEQHARACCDDPDGHFDCRTWPFVDEPSTLGQVCAQHEDCEAGLACSPTAGSGYGICTCPGISTDTISPPDSCF